MKLVLVIVLVAFGFIACEETNCEKATKKYNNAVQAFSMAEASYEAAKTAVDQACSLFGKEDDTKAINITEACNTAKTVLSSASIAFTAAKTAMAIYKTQVDAKCAE